jgi:hypothetical protein
MYGNGIRTGQRPSTLRETSGRGSLAGGRPLIDHWQAQARWHDAHVEI